jgi:asparagine synthase (glutamine-hydrolysing)
MSAFAGIVALHGSSIDRRAQDRAAGALTALRNGRTVARRVEGGLIVQRVGPGDTDGATRPLTSPDARTLFAALARIDNREELGGALGIAGTELVQTSSATLIQRAYERWGDGGVARCLGAFAFAHWDAAARRLTLGRDCLGNRPLFYHRGPEFVSFATTLGALLALPGVPRAIDELALANFLALSMSEGSRTFYRGIERVPSRTLVTIDGTGARPRHYWAPDLDSPPPYRRDEDYVERARELLDVAVASATHDTPRVAIATSGGLDSSAIAATAARQGRAESITCFCMVPPPGTDVDVGPFRYLDERDKVEELARMYPSLNIRFIAPDRIHTKAYDDTLYFVPANLPSLAPASFGVGPYRPEAVAAAGHRAVLIGNYGNFGLTWGGNFSLVELVRAHQWKDFARELHDVARESNRSLVRTLAGDVVMPAAPIWLRRLIYRLRGRDPDSVAHYSALNPTFIADADLARQWRVRDFDPWFGPDFRDPKRTRAYRLFDHNQYSRDIRGLAPEIFGHELRDPHADRRLLEFALSVPEPMYRRDGISRSFARRVLADRLPHVILDERRHGANTPTWFRALDARRDDIAADIERLEASPLASRLIDLPRLKRLMAQWPKDENEAEKRRSEYRLALARGIHVGRFVRWVEGGNA